MIESQRRREANRGMVPAQALGLDISARPCNSKVRRKTGEDGREKGLLGGRWAGRNRLGSCGFSVRTERRVSAWPFEAFQSDTVSEFRQTNHRRVTFLDEFPKTCGQHVSIPVASYPITATM